MTIFFIQTLSYYPHCDYGVLNDEIVAIRARRVVSRNRSKTALSPLNIRKVPGLKVDFDIS